jgi:hypothetical protein
LLEPHGLKNGSRRDLVAPSDLVGITTAAAEILG